MHKQVTSREVRAPRVSRGRCKIGCVDSCVCIVSCGAEKKNSSISVSGAIWV